MANQPATYDPRTMLASGSRVVIVISAGPYPTPPRAFAQVPDVMGTDQGKALSALQEAGLVAQVFNDYSEVYKRGDVMGQLPVGGASVPTGAETVLLVSSGPATAPMRGETLPEVVGRTEAEAVSMLQAASFLPQVVREYSNSVPEGTVISQLPSQASLAAQPEKRSKWVMWAAIAAALVVLGLLAFLFLRSGDTIVIPDVTGKTQAEAVEELEAAGLEVKVTEAAPDEAGDAEEGTVIAQEPPAGSEVPGGSEVEIIVAPGVELVEVPDVVGHDQAAARETLEAAGFSVVDTLEDSRTIAKGLVIQQTPPGGTEAPAESEVAIVISNGQPQEEEEENVEVPDVEGLTKDDAQDALTDLGLKVVVAENPSDTVAKDTVIMQLPAAGDSVAPGTSVGIVVSTGPAADADKIDTPDVVGQTLAEAQQVLSDAGLEAIPVPSTGSGKPANEVIAQAPEAGTQVAQGSGVVVYYSSGQ